MPLIPLSFLFALLCLMLLIKLGRPQRRHGIFQLLLALCIWQSLLVGIRYGYHLDGILRLQPPGAMAIPVVACLALWSCTQQNTARRGLGFLLPLPLALTACYLAPFSTDGLIVLCYLGYGVAMLFLLRGGEDRLQQVTLSESGLSYRLWRGLAGALLLCGGAELAIAADFALFAGRHAGQLATAGSLAVTLSVWLALRHTRPPQEEATEPVSPPLAISEDTAAWFALIQQRLQQDSLYLDPELNLMRLARKAGLPARKVSQVINQQAGMSVSQYVNQLRIRQAAAWLSQSDRSVTDIMLESGFITKSNFNREFQRVMGMNPSEWRKRPV